MKYLIQIALITCIQFAAIGQEIRGKIIDDQSGSPISGAAIQVIGSEKGTVTDAQGRFSLEQLPENSQLKISYLGYLSQKITVSGSKSLTIRLEASEKQMQEVVVTANREASLRSEVPIAISKISPKIIEETKAIALYELVNKSPGVLMVNLNNEQHAMAIRQPMNYSNYYLYLEDGLPIRPMGVFNHNALLEINQMALETIEVVKGPVSSIYGPEAVGGAVNFITQKPTAVPTAQIGFQLDQFGYKRLQFGAGAQMGKFGIYVGGLTSKQNDSWMANSDYDKHSVNIRAEYHFKPQTRLIGTLAYGNYFSQTGGNVDSIAFHSRKYPSNNDFTYRESIALRTRLTLEQDWSGTSKSFLTLFHRDNEMCQNPSYRIRWNQGSTTATGEINANKFKSYGLLTQHSKRWSLLDSRLMVGGMLDISPNYYQAHQIELNAIMRPDGLSVERYELEKERPDIVRADYEALIRNSAGYLQFDFSPFSAMRISTGLRYDRMFFTYDNYLDESSGEKAYQQVTPKMGLTYDFGKDKGIYANYSQGFAPPGLTAIFRKKNGSDEFYYNLEPAQFQNYEIGGWASYWENKLYIDLALYQMDGRHELLSIRQADGSTDYQSAGKTLHRGFELGITAKPNDQLQFRWSGTSALHRFEDFQINEDGSKGVENLAGFEMPSSPRWIWNTELRYQPNWLPNFRSSLEWQHVSGWYQNQVNTVSYDGYEVLNLRWGYQWKGLELFTNIMNLTDALYAYNVSSNNSGNRTNYSPAAPRTFVMGLQYRFVGKK
ncbi:TonB-dependent receptor [Echinicola jeungdonensis]|uniref:TonB-dependent receptor domain-containing protein n=1 Tax=Echinicola jeungdonensis TaxID=709343 RepID=A0ABV5J262_9BACT|nr:TonB-dependent receptor [Echinicola jeungdonensis]MDN3669061.1 TonB-dependent receptor [Echinicola jeungdonensis]